MRPTALHQTWVSGTRVDRALILGILFLSIALLVTVFMASSSRNDMDIFLEASRDMLHGENMYLNTYNTWYSYLYSPFFALLISPLLLLPPFWAKVIWGLASLFAAFRSVHLSSLYLGISKTFDRKALVLHFVAFLVLFQAIRDNLNAMQVTLLLVWCCLEALRLVRKDAWLSAGALIALGADMKLIPLVLLPYLLWRGQWKPVLAAGFVLVLLHLLPAIPLGWERTEALHRTRMEVLDPSATRHIIDEEEPSFISLGSLFSAFLSTQGGNDHSPGTPRSIAELPLEQLSTLLLLGRLLLLASVTVVLGATLFRPERSQEHALREVGYLLLVCVLFFPHQRPYSMFLAAPAVVWLIHFSINSAFESWRTTWRWLLLAGVIYLMINTDLLLGEYSPYYAHYKVLSFATIALLEMVLWATPERMQRRMGIQRAQHAKEEAG